MDLGLTGRTAIVSGASSGIGLAIAEALADEGANVTMFARRRDVLEREAERIGALPVRGDVRVRRDLENLVDRTIAAFGGIDVLVNNSGGPPRGTARDADTDALEAAVELLLVPVVRLTQPPPPRAQRPRSRDHRHVEQCARTDRRPRAVERGASRRRRLVEDARPGAGTARYHRQRRRAGADRHGTDP